MSHLRCDSKRVTDCIIARGIMLIIRTVLLFHRPMLSERSGLDRVDKQMKNKPFFVEPKHDGERVQLHKDGDR